MITKAKKPDSLISIIIVNYNTRQLLEECIRSLDPESLPDEFNLVVIDNKSPDGSATMIKEKFPSLPLVEMGENAGFPKAVNRGIRYFPAPYYFILNSDTKVTQQQIKEIIKIMDKNPEIGALTPFQVNADGNPQLAWGDVPSLFQEARRKKLQDKLDRGDRRARAQLESISGEIVEVGWVGGATLLLRDRALKETGFMDENIFIFFEDIDICMRMRSRGWKIALCPDVKVLHHRGESAKKDKFNSSLHYRRSQLYFWKKHHGTLSNMLLETYLLLKFLLRLSSLKLRSLKKEIDSEEHMEQVKLVKRILKLILSGK